MPPNLVDTIGDVSLIIFVSFERFILLEWANVAVAHVERQKMLAIALVFCGVWCFDCCLRCPLERIECGTVCALELVLLSGMWERRK